LHRRRLRRSTQGHASSADRTRPVLTHLLVEIRPGDFEM
jgi:hypothetical protein